MSRPQPVVRSLSPLIRERRLEPLQPESRREPLRNRGGCSIIRALPVSEAGVALSASHGTETGIFGEKCPGQCTTCQDAPISIY